MQKLYFIFVILIGFASCTPGSRIEKRHYRNGFYISSWQRDHQVPPRDTSVAASGEVEETVLINATVRDTVDAQQNAVETPQENNQTSALPAASVREDAPVASDDSVAGIAPAEKKQNRFPLRYNGPAEARPLSVMLWIGFLALVLGIIAIICAFAPMIGAAAVFGVAAPFLIIGALVLGFIVARKARKKRDAYAQTDPETARFYHQMRFKALVLAGVATGIVVLFILTMIAVIAALSNFH